MASHLRHLAIVALVSALFSCYYVEDRQKVDKTTLADSREVGVPTKVHLTDGSVILFSDGFTFARDTLAGRGERYSLVRGESFLGNWWSIPIDSVVGLEYYRYGLPGARQLGSFLLGTTVTAEVGLAAIIVLKAIFGSCPTVYTLSDTGVTLEAECFSYSIGRMFEKRLT